MEPKALLYVLYNDSRPIYRLSCYDIYLDASSKLTKREVLNWICQCLHEYSKRNAQRYSSTGKQRRLSGVVRRGRVFGELIETLKLEYYVRKHFIRRRKTESGQETIVDEGILSDVWISHNSYWKQKKFNHVEDHDILIYYGLDNAAYDKIKADVEISMVEIEKVFQSFMEFDGPPEMLINNPKLTREILKFLSQFMYIFLGRIMANIHDLENLYGKTQGDIVMNFIMGNR